MHEAHIVSSLFKAAVENAQQHGATRVTDVNLRLGAYSSVKPDSVQFYWDTLSPGTVCEGAQLHFLQEPATAKCLDCGHTFSPEAEKELCPVCGGARLELSGGNSIQLESLEID